jgi:hypothetical protein
MVPNVESSPENSELKAYFLEEISTTGRLCNLYKVGPSGISLKWTVGPHLLALPLFHFLVRSWAALLYHELSAIMCSHKSKNIVVNWPRTETWKTLSQNKRFVFLNWLFQVFVTVVKADWHNMCVCVYMHLYHISYPVFGYGPISDLNGIDIILSINAWWLPKDVGFSIKHTYLPGELYPWVSIYTDTVR